MTTDHGQIEVRSLSDRIYEQLEGRILEMRIRPGERLVIDQLARELGVSATPVRDALMRMAAEHLVEFAPYRGFSTLPEPTVDEIAKSFEARLGVEAFAGRLACDRITDEEVDELVAIQEQIASQKYGAAFESWLPFVELNRRFHEAIVAATRNEFLVEALKSLYHDSMISRTLHDRGVPDIENISQEHEAIIDAFRRRDRDAVERAIRRHIADGAARMIAASQ